MSGYKHATVTISQEEYRRLQERDMQKRLRAYDRVKTQDSGQDQAILNLIHQLEEREQQFQAALSSLGNTNSPIDQDLIRNLMQQNAQYYERVVSRLRSSNQEMENAFSLLTDDFYNAMQAEREYTNQTLQSLLVEQDIYSRNEAARAEAAQQWVNQCLSVMDFIQRSYDHGRFVPGRLDRIMRNLSFAESNLANGFFESSLQTGQQMYLELSDMIFELEQYQLAWQSLFDQTYASVSEMIFQMVNNGKVNAIGLQGEELPDYVDLNYWSDGRFRQLLDHTRQLGTYLSQEQNLLTNTDLERIYTQILPAIRESFEVIIYEARLGTLNSQLRMNIAEKALEALENHGFSLNAAGYAENDMRSQFNAHLACPDGSEVTINVIPTERSRQEISNDLVVITTHPYLKTEHEARMHWDELCQTLGLYSLKVSRSIVESNPAADTTDPSTVQQGQLEHRINQFER